VKGVSESAKLVLKYAKCVWRDDWGLVVWWKMFIFASKLQ
jgi:hypothetical protein